MSLRSIVTETSAFGKMLKSQLAHRGLTQVWLAAEVGVAPTSISRVVRGTRRPSAELVLAISRALNMSRRTEAEVLDAAGYGRARADGFAFGSGVDLNRSNGDELVLTLLDKLETLKSTLEAIDDRIAALSNRIEATEKAVQAIAEARPDVD